MTLQLLLENAIQHNLGTEKKPILVQITIDEYITISNNTNLKQLRKPTSGRALNNLNEQYRLLSKKPIQIHQMENSFSAVVPIIYKQKA